MSRDSEQILIELALLRLRSGDERALEEVVRYWHPVLMRFATRLVERPDVAADVMEDAWLAIVKGVTRLDDPAAFAGWAYRIVSNKAADWIKKEQRSRRIQQMAAAAPVEPTFALEAGNEEADAVRSAVRRLPNEQRIVIAMFYLDGLSVEAIATALALPAGTVKSRLHAARNRLRHILERTAHVES